VSDRLEDIAARREAAERAITAFRSHYAERSRERVSQLGTVVNALFARMQANRMFDRIQMGAGEDFLRWLAGADGHTFDPTTEFSQGQRQDLALSLFLARARSLGGTFFLDEPLLHLDDLNRIGLLDVLRAVAIEDSTSLNLVVTTASRAIARHLAEKFARVPRLNGELGVSPALRIVELKGNARAGVEKIDLIPNRA
jgi:ABC-type molybdenum transport system ATPase subunit/photorepair protein PhrA